MWSRFLSIAVALVLLAGPALAIVDESLTALILAYSPGGVAEMSLIALSLQISVAFVTVHHMLRIFIAVLLPPLAYRILIDREARFEQ